MVCDKYTLSITNIENDNGRYLLNAHAGDLRGDNKTIIENGKSFIEPCSTIELRKENKLNFKPLIKKIIHTLHYYRFLLGIKNKLYRIYFAVNLTIIDQLSKDLNEELGKISFLLTFMDTDIFENYITQTLQNRGIKVAALQHGQRFYINEPCDSFVGMDNMTADYKLVWSEFSRKQYLKAGFPIERLPIVGSTKYLKTFTRSKRQTRVIGIFIDGPFSYGSKLANAKLLNIVINVANTLGFQCLLKPHPADTLEGYENILRFGNVKIVEPDQSIESISDKIDFAVVHTSGVSIDLLILDIPVFVYKTNAIFPIELSQSYFFKTNEDFVRIVCNFRDNKYADFENLRNQYITPNPYQLHKVFFSTVLGDV